MIALAALTPPPASRNESWIVSIGVARIIEPYKALPELDISGIMGVTLENAFAAHKHQGQRPGRRGRPDRRNRRLTEPFAFSCGSG